jgi:adenylate cyclase
MRQIRTSPRVLLTLSFLLIGVAWGGFLGSRQIAGTASVLDRLEYLTADWRFLLTGTQAAPRGVVIAAIDDETVRTHGYPLPRFVLAQILRALAAQHPQGLAVDLLFLDPGNPEMDVELGDALGLTRSVVAAMGVFERAQSPTGPPVHVQSGQFAAVPIASDIVWPIPAIRHAARSGLVNLTTDHAGVPRFVPMIYQAPNSVVPSFALAALSVAFTNEPVLGPDRLEVAGRTLHTDLGYHLPIRYYGPRGSIRQFSAARLLRGDLDPNDVRGEVVLLGATAVALGDTFATPFDRGIPGVEVFATAIGNILGGDALVRTSLIRKIDAATAIALPVVIVLLAGMRRSLLGTVLGAGVLALWGMAIVAAFAAGYWLSIAVPLCAVLPIASANGLARLALDRRAEKRLTRERAELARFQSPLLVEQVLKDPNFLEQPVHQDVAVVFLDLSGFTGVAEALGPQRTRELLAQFQALVDREVADYRGYVASFMGDGALIIFGLPQASPDDAARALKAIAQLHESVARWLGTLVPTARDRMSLRIGGHFGPAVLSRLGSRTHQHITATGDTVNAASRLLEVAKEQRANVLITEDLHKAAQGDAPPTAPAPPGPAIEVRVRGRAQPLWIRVLS